MDRHTNEAATSPDFFNIHVLYHNPVYRSLFSGRL
jgi:hypothetical protein